MDSMFGVLKLKCNNIFQKENIKSVKIKKSYKVNNEHWNKPYVQQS